MKTNQENRLVSEKVCSTVDHLQTINQLIEKLNEFKRPLCIAYIGYEKAFDSIEQETILKVLRSIGIYETYITFLEDIYTGASARVYMDNQVSEDIPIQDPVSPKLFTATI